jgi:hypothetical protein
MSHDMQLVQQPAVRVRLSYLLNEALDRAIRCASRRAFKHDDRPITTPEELEGRVEEELDSAFWGVLAELGVEIE